MKNLLIALILMLGVSIFYSCSKTECETCVYTFVWEENEHHSNKGNDVGVIAQEIEEILPEITTTRENGYKAVRYEKLTPFLISCIKEQQTQISSLQSQIDELKALIKNN